MMKILIVRNVPNYVELRHSMYNIQEIGLAKALSRKGHICDLVFFGGKHEEIVQLDYNDGIHIKVHYLKGFSFLKNGIYMGIDKLINQYDVIQAGGYDQLETWLLARKYSNKMVVYNGTYFSALNYRYNKKCKIIDCIFVPRYIKKGTFFVTKNMLSARFLNEKGMNNIYPIGVGLDDEQLKSCFEADTDISRRLSALKAENKLLLYIGRIEPRRNITFLLEVFAKVQQKEKKVKLVIIGTGEKDYIDYCFSKAKELGIEENIEYFEKIEQKYVNNIYKQCDLFLLPTLYEIFGMVLLEAMYFGLPVVTSNNGGSDMLITNEINGFVIEKFDENQWAEKVLNLIQDRELCISVGEKAKQYITSNFTWDVLAEKFIKIYMKRISE